MQMQLRALALPQNMPSVLLAKKCPLLVPLRNCRRPGVLVLVNDTDWELW